MTEAKKRKNYYLLIFSLVLLFNPNLNVVDILPDFIAWFILARLFERASDSAPHFEEAREAFIRLGWLNLLKIPAFLLILFVKSKDTYDNNIYTLVSFSFAIFEIILTVGATKNFFSALFHLGERTEAQSLIKPFSNNALREYTPELLKNFTYLFFIAKTAFYVIPDLFLLTRVSDKGYVIAGSKFYPFVMAASLVLGITIGILWLLSTKKYISNIHSEDKFYSALDAMITERGAANFEAKAKLRLTVNSLTLLCVATFFSIELTFDSWKGINLLPHFLYGIMLIIACHYISKVQKASAFKLYVSGAIFSLCALVHYVVSVDFHTRYEYRDLIENASAKSAYSLLQITALVEFVALSVFLIFVFKALNSFVVNNTGVDIDSDRYGKLEFEFHRALKIKNLVLTLLGILAGAAKCVNVFLNSEVQIFFSETNTIFASSLPWFGVVVTFTALAYIGFAFFYISSLKDEVRMKYLSI